jgi:Na+-transporting methylmalonyl-CoA/oxaloacetate decarboxylase gamma subunit
MTAWSQAFSVFIVGLGGVFTCLIILQVSTKLFSVIVVFIEKRMNK